jgi:transketolase
MNNEAQKLNQIKKDIFLTAYSSRMKAAHLASAYSIADVLFALYFRDILSYRPDEPEWEDRDRVILSKGHASLALYSVMCGAGFFKRDELFTFCQSNTRLGGEPNMNILPGIEACSGSLGHGLSFGIGIALAKKLDNKPGNTYVIIGDGESQEGSVWEGVMSAPAHKLDNLTVILDFNRIQKMGRVEDSMGINDWQNKWEAFGWDTYRVNGHNINEIETCFKSYLPSGKPRLIIAETVKGHGVSIMENDPNWHFKMPNKKELKIFMNELNISETELTECREHI